MKVPGSRQDVGRVPGTACSFREPSRWIPLTWDRSPAAASPVSRRMRVTFFIEILRGIIVRGAGWDALWDEAVALAAFALIVTVLAALRFRKTLE